jgi:hypothetical protein
MQVTIPETGFVRLAQVLEVIPIGKTCWWEGVKSGTLPQAGKVVGTLRRLEGGSLTFGLILGYNSYEIPQW